jgi:hypothetical protein
MRMVRLRGGLGNQLFGLAFAHSVKHLGGEPVAADVSGFQHDRYGRVFVTGALAAQLGLQQGSRPSLRSALSRLSFPGQVREGRAPTDLSSLAIRGRYFDGYWQDEAYIAAPPIVRALARTFLDSMSADADADAHDIVVHQRSYQEETISARRRGPAPDYVARATDLIEKRLGRTRDIVVISDATPGADPFADMAVLLKARALVLANSSFSWWAGYCGDAAVVAYPERGGAFHYPAPARAFEVV